MVKNLKYNINLIPVPGYDKEGNPGTIDEITYCWAEAEVDKNGKTTKEAIETVIGAEAREVELTEQQCNRLKARYQNVVIIPILEEEVLEEAPVENKERKTK